MRALLEKFYGFLQQFHEHIFGSWRDKSLERIVNFDKPGTYFLSAKAFGIKGALGGDHTWIVHKDDDEEYVIELTDIESLEIQGSGRYWPLITSHVKPNDLTIFVSDRFGGQRWFGEMPVIWLKITDKNITIDTLIALAKQYPELDNYFHITGRNCNTFTSWMVYAIEQKLDLPLPETPHFIGARTKLQWRKKGKKIK